MENYSRYSTLILMIIRIIRDERGIPLMVWGEKLGKSVSAMSKIENFQSNMNVESLYAAAQALNISISYLMSISEKLVWIFSRHDIYFNVVFDEKEDKDFLVPLIKEYFSSKGYEMVGSRIFRGYQGIEQVVDGFFPNDYPTIVAYCCDPDFKKWYDAGAGYLDGAPMPQGRIYLSGR